MKQEREKFIKYFLVQLFLLGLVGIIMVYSSSYLYAKELVGNSHHFFLRQVLYFFLGLSVMFLLGRTKFSFWYKNHLWPNTLFTVLLLLTLLPGFGVNLKGAYRWISVWDFYFQPGEFIKYSLLLMSIYFFENFQTMEMKKRVLYLISLFLPLVVLLCQPDFGAFAICFLVMSFVCFLSSFPRKYFYTILSLAPICISGLLFLAPYRVQRIMTFLDPWKDPKRSGFQIIQSYLAFANGAVWGKGIGNSNEKLFYLPEAHNDFIFSVIGEEFGFVGVVFVVLAFLALLYWGFRLSLKLPCRISTLFVASVVFALGLQAFLNMGVVLGLLPTKGLNLPFISYGGSSMLSNFMSIGLLLSACQGDVLPRTFSLSNTHPEPAYPPA